MIRIVAVDDHELIREGIKKILRSAGDMRIVGEAATLPQALQLIAKEAPDVTVLDINLADIDGLDGLVQIRRLFPQLSVLVLSMYPEDRYALRALQAGAAGYITKSMAAEELVNAIRQIHSSGSYISPRVAALLAAAVREPRRTVPQEQLTQRELEVITLIGSGKRTKQIAAELDISISSVNTYRSRIFRKMGWSSNASLVRYAVEQGLLK